MPLGKMVVSLNVPDLGFLRMASALGLSQPKLLLLVSQPCLSQVNSCFFLNSYLSDPRCPQIVRNFFWRYYRETLWPESPLKSFLLTLSLIWNTSHHHCV